ncbi:hypothetical protein AX14_010657, partial [Amanita brunnescens Koide BX004]
ILSKRVKEGASNPAHPSSPPAPSESVNKRFTIDFINASYVVNMVPPFLQPVIKPFLNEREAQKARYGKNWAERPNDVVSWLVEISKGQERCLEEITMFVLFVNFAAIHTTTMARTFVFIDQSFAHSSQTVTHSLYNLAAYQDYVQPLREEIESVLQEHGWSKASVAKMTKLDSFVNETMRLSPIAAFLMTTFSME